MSSGTCSACLLFHPSHWLKCWTGQVFLPGWHWSINQYSLGRESQQVMNSNNPTTSSHHPSHPISYIVVFLFSVEMGMEEGTKIVGVHFCKRKMGSWRYIRMLFSSVQSLSRVQLFATPWIAARQASLSITNSQSSLRLMSIESVMPSSHLCHPLSLLPPIPPSIRVFANESTLRMRWPKYWSFSFSIIPFKEHPGLISFRMDWLDLLAVQGTLKSLLQHHSSKASILWCSAFFTVQLTSIHDHRKNHSLD